MLLLHRRLEPGAAFRLVLPPTNPREEQLSPCGRAFYQQPSVLGAGRPRCLAEHRVWRRRRPVRATNTRAPRAVLPPPALASHWLLSVPLSQRRCSLAAVAAKSRLPFPRALRLRRPALRSRGHSCDRTVCHVLVRADGRGGPGGTLGGREATLHLLNQNCGQLSKTPRSV